MTEEIKLSKFDNEPWGFRLTGGKDFGTVLTVIKIVQGSLAEKAGMKVGDLLLAINDQPLTNTTHREAHDIIIHAGNNFVFTIVRGSLVLPPPFLKTEIRAKVSMNENEQCFNAEEVSNNMFEGLETAMEKELTIATLKHQRLSIPPSPDPIIQETPSAITAQEPMIVSKATKNNEDESQPTTEEELQDVMLGHAEVISGNAIGVDFYKMAPKCEVIEKSEVLQVINDEKLIEAKKTISKFLQQPNRPKVKPKQCNTSAVTPHKPLIVSPKKGDPEPEIPNEQNQQPSEQPSEKEKQEQLTSQGEIQCEETIQEQKEQEDQGEQTRPQEQKDQEKQHDQTDEKTQEQTQEQANWDSDLTQEEQAILQEMAAINACISEIDQLQETESQNRSPEFEKQLKKVNEQLKNLLCMPLDMQRYLLQVKKQIEELRRLKNPPPPEPEPEPQPQPEPGNATGKTPTPTPESEGQSGKGSPQDDVEKQEISKEESEDANTQTAEPEPPAEPEEIGPPKHPRRDIQWQKDPHPKNRPFFPLTPKPRPVVLPEDAPIFHNNKLFSEDFIAETLIGNAEVIQGTTIGVNFMKFKKNYDHLQSSDVYKLIHNEEKSNTNFPSRSGKIPSQEDCIESVSNTTE